MQDSGNNVVATDNDVIELQRAMNNVTLPIEKRFRSLFTLRAVGTRSAIDAMASGLSDDSALLRHEIAYCLGQMGNGYALDILEHTLANNLEHPMVRHEAAEAIGALAVHDKSLNILKQYTNDSVPEVAETCQLAVARVDWLDENSDEALRIHASQKTYLCVDPAPALQAVPIEQLKLIFLNPLEHVFKRYRAMFALRELGTDASVLVLASIFTDPALRGSSALLKHEVAFVLGQLQNALAIPALTEALSNTCESAMVRHEAAEALGAIAEQEAVPLLQQYLTDKEPIVSESCRVALDVADYFNNTESFQYADGLKILLEKRIVE